MPVVKPDIFSRLLTAGLDQYKGALVFGPNWDLVHRLAEDTVAAFRKADPDIEIVRLASADVNDCPGKLLEEVQALSLFGSAKLVVCEASAASAYKECVSATSVGWSDCFLLVLAGDLKKSVAIRKEFEASPDLAAVVCYEQSADELAATVRDMLQAHGFSADAEAAMAIVEAVSGNAALLQSEVDKISAYSMGQQVITVEDVAAIGADNRSSPVDALLDRTFSGERNEALASLGDLHSAGVAASSVLVALTNHFMLLSQMVAACGGGRRADAVVKEWRPPVFWKRQATLANQVRKLAGQDLAALNHAVLMAGEASRHNHAIAWPVLERLVLALATRLRTS